MVQQLTSPVRVDFDNGDDDNSGVGSLSPITGPNTASVTAGSPNVEGIDSTLVNIGDVINVATTGGNRRLNAVVSKPSGTSVVCDRNWDATESNLGWRVGGSLKTLPGSRVMADCDDRWVVHLLTDATYSDTTVVSWLPSAGGTSSRMAIASDVEGVRRKITLDADKPHFQQIQQTTVDIFDFDLENVAISKSNAIGWEEDWNFCRVNPFNVGFGTPTGRLLRGISRGVSMEGLLGAVARCTFWCTDTGIYLPGNNGGMGSLVDLCVFYGGVSTNNAINVQSSRVKRCIFDSWEGVTLNLFTGQITQAYEVENCVFWNGGAAFVGGTSNAFAEEGYVSGNMFAQTNAGYAIDVNNVAGESKWMIDRNAFWNIAAGSPYSPQTLSRYAPRNTIDLGQEAGNQPLVDPANVDQASRNFNINDGPGGSIWRAALQEMGV